MSLAPAERADPLRTYHFRVLVNGIVVAGVQKVSGLSVAVGARETWEGGNALHRYANPDRASWEPVRLHQCLALDQTLENWALAAVSFLRTGVAPALTVKRDVVIEMLDHALPNSDRPVRRRYLVHNAWVSRYEAVPALDALGNEVALLSVELTHEGWEPDPQPAPVAPDPASLPGAGDLAPTANTRIA